MSSTDINQVLAQMRLMAAQAAGESVKPTPATGGAEFRQLLEQSIDQVNQTQQQAEQLKASFETGEGDANLTEVMVAIQKSSLSFEAMVQVRNKLVEAYRDVMNMPI